MPSSPSALNLSQHQGLFQWVLFCIRWPKYWSFSFSIKLSRLYLGLISLKIDWSDPLAVQGTLRSLLQHHSLKASIIWHSAFFTVQLSQHFTVIIEYFRVIIEYFLGPDITYFPNFFKSIFWNFSKSLELSTFLEMDERSLAYFKPPNFQGHLKEYLMLSLRGILSAFLTHYFLSWEKLHC